MVYTKLVVCEVIKGSVRRELATPTLCIFVPDFLEKSSTHLWPFPPLYMQCESPQQESVADEGSEDNLTALYSNLVAAGRFYSMESRDREQNVGLLLEDSWERILQWVVDAALPLLRRAALLMHAVR